MNIGKDQIFKRIDKDFNKAKSLVFVQFEILEQMISNGIDAINPERLKQFKDNEKELDQFEISIGDEIIQTIVKHQPMASDLRRIISTFRMINNLERIGDQLNNIAQFIDNLTNHQIAEHQKESIANMFSMSQNMVTKALVSFRDGDYDYAIWTIKNDEIVDQLQQKLLTKNILKQSKQDLGTSEITDILNYANILSSIERIADHATNIAEASIYYLKGIDLRHVDLDQQLNPQMD